MSKTSRVFILEIARDIGDIGDEHYVVTNNCFRLCNGVFLNVTIFILYMLLLV